MGLPASRRQMLKLIEEHYLSLYRYAYRLSGSAADAEDLTQETMCKAQLKLGQLRNSASAKAWLFRILRNTYLQQLRSQREPWLSLEDMDDFPARLPEPLPAVDAAELQEALNDLPEGFRTPLILFYFDDFSYREIADQMELPLGTVMSRLARAKAHLLAKLLRRVPEALIGGQRRTTDGL